MPKPCEYLFSKQQVFCFYADKKNGKNFLYLLVITLNNSFSWSDNNSMQHFWANDINT